MRSRTLVIGDVHGCLVELDTLLQAIKLSSSDHLIMLGDLVDRGADSAGVLSRMIAVSRSAFINN